MICAISANSTDCSPTNISGSFYNVEECTISYSSTIELLNDLIIANDLKFLTDEKYTEGREKIEKQTLLIAGLRKSQQRFNFRSILNFLNL